MRKLLLSVTTALVGLAGTAKAEGFYAGLMFGQTKSQIFFPNPGIELSDSSQAVILGKKFKFQNNVTLAGEVEVGRIEDPRFTDFPNRANRARILLGYQLDMFEIFAAAGYSHLDSDSTITRSGSGTNIGLGVNVAVSDRIDLRAEVLRDNNIDASTNGYSWDVQTTRVGAIFKF